MDSLTQAALGASLAGVCAPPGLRRRALLLGAALGTAPDLDVLIDYGDPVANMTRHRGFSHSLIVLVPLAGVLWYALRRFWTSARTAPRRFFVLLALALVTHPLLDAHTVYGTQLLWPLTTPPVMWSTLFIIDPLYTLPLLAGIVLAAWRPRWRRAGPALAAGLVLSTAYVGWSWIARSQVESAAGATLASLGLTDAPRFATPAPFNTLLWRVVVMTPTGYLQGYRSLIADRGPLRFEAFTSDVGALAQARELAAVERLRWFTHGFLKAAVVDDRLVLSDLRMGSEPTYVFSHAVARRGNPHWYAIEPQRIGATFALSDLRSLWARLLADPGAGLPPPGTP